MKTWIIVRGPDKEQALKEATAKAVELRKGKGVIMVSDALAWNIDHLPRDSVTVIYLQDKEADMHIVSEDHTRYMIFAIGINSSAQAVRLTQGMQELGTVAVLGKVPQTFPEGEDPFKCHTVIIDYPTEDTEVVHLMFDSEAYYGWVNPRKFQPRKILP